MLGERQSPVVAGLALCAASAGHHVCVLLPRWSHTVETHRPRAEQKLTTTKTKQVNFAKKELGQVSLKAAEFDCSTEI